MLRDGGLRIAREDDEAQRRHDAAVAAGEPGYLDPGSGLFVLTAAYLRDRGECCGKSCRHCPYDA